MMLKRILIFFLISCNNAFAQPTIISFFNGSQLSETVYLSFTIAAGQTCNGIEIQRSTDSVNFYKIGEIAGSCGSVSVPVNYSYTDSFPFHNTTNFYRIAPGNNDWSTVIKVYFKQHDENDFVITPNPFHTITTINYQNPLRKSISWKLFDANGKQTTEGSTKEESFTINKNNLTYGLYFLELLIDNKDFQKVKLVIE